MTAKNDKPQLPARVESAEDALVRQINSEQMIATLAKFLPPSLPAPRFVRQVTTLIRKTPQLATCDPVSIMGGMIQAAELGLELSGVLGHCYLIPRRNGQRRCMEAVFQMGVKGYREMALRSGHALAFSTHIVHEGDEFHFCYGSNARVFHIPSGKAGQKATHYYCVVKLAGRVEDFEVMTVEECREWMNKYSKIPGGWKDFDGMALKTVCGKVARRLRLSTEIQAPFRAEGERDSLLDSWTEKTKDALSGLIGERVESVIPADAPIDEGEYPGDPEPDLPDPDVIVNAKP